MKTQDPKAPYSQHRGEILQKAIRQRFRTVKEAAERLGIGRSTLYSYFDLPWVEDSIFLKVTAITGADFTGVLEEFDTSLVQDEMSKALLQHSENTVNIHISLNGNPAHRRRIIAQITTLDKALQDLNEQEEEQRRLNLERAKSKK